jgi:NAD(P)-dependent dehydrogenase (short-subunit alcohol dehydrogenase family)
MDLRGATALVTGANRGIGRSIVERLAREPLGLILAGVRDPARFDPVRARAEVRPVRIDFSSRESIEGSLAGLERRDEIDLLVNNAGRMTGGLPEERDLEWAERVCRIESDQSVLGPGGRLALAKLASRGPAFLLDRISAGMFSRDAG